MKGKRHNRTTQLFKDKQLSKSAAAAWRERVAVDQQPDQFVLIEQNQTQFVSAPEVVQEAAAHQKRNRIRVECEAVRRAAHTGHHRLQSEQFEKIFGERRQCQHQVQQLVATALRLLDDWADPHRHRSAFGNDSFIVREWRADQLAGRWVLDTASPGLSSGNYASYIVSINSFFIFLWSSRRLCV